ncbi:hypothetical protein IT575_08415 [bacterium]|nr:hypothetical protein [bacterium]
MLHKTACESCAGSGIRMIETSSLLGLLKKQVPITCEDCNGKGEVLEIPRCETCGGRGLLGNENEICRTCNGTGHLDSFALIPLELVQPGTTFARHCDRCKNDQFEIVSLKEQHRITRTWEAEEELRKVDIIDRVKVKCTGCSNTYYITVDPRHHLPVPVELIAELENQGLNLSFLYAGRSPLIRGLEPGAPPAQPTA